MMKHINIALITLFLFYLSFSEAMAARPGYDQVSIGYIPSRGGTYKGRPYIVLRAKTLSHHKNQEIRKFYIALSKLAAKGIKNNATRFHQPAKYIEAIYQGKRVRLFFAGSSNLDKYRVYEMQWKSLHNELYVYLTNKISPTD